VQLPAVLIVHGLGGSGPDHWTTWLAETLRARGARVRYPLLPSPDTPDPEAWAAALHDELAGLAKHPAERVVACHSLSCTLWMREAGRIAAPDRPDRVALVAPPSLDAVPPEAASLFDPAPDSEALAAAAGHTRIVCSEPDPYCPGGAANEWARPLDLPFDLLPDSGHINVDAGYGPWDSMAAWVLDASAPLRARLR